MERFLVSVIVPVYKAGRFLPRCMESIFAQSYEPLEIILVDDGSPDECPKICDDYAAGHENVRVIHQENAGLGMARNAGIRDARGEYLCFVDADDELGGPESIARLARRAGHADIVQGSYCRLYPDGSRSGADLHRLKSGSYTATADFRFKGFYYYGHLSYNWGKLYRKRFLTDNGIYCKAYPFSQDKAHNLECLSYGARYAFVDDCVYCYRVNEDSVTFRYKENLIPVWLAIAEDYLDFCGVRGLPAYEDLVAYHIFFGSFFVAQQELLAGHGIGAARRELKRYGSDPFVRRYMRCSAMAGYMRAVHGGVWNALIPMASALFSAHAYGLYALGIDILLHLHIDKKITSSRHGGKRKV